MSLGVTTANSKVAELFCRHSFGDSAFSIGLERSIVADYTTDGMNDNVVSAEVACDGAASLVGKRRTVCGNESCGGPGGPRGDNVTSACCEQCEGSVCCERRGRGRKEPDGWRETSVVDWISNVLHHHD